MNVILAHPAMGRRDRGSLWLTLLSFVWENSCSGIPHTHTVFFRLLFEQCCLVTSYTTTCKFASFRGLKITYSFPRTLFWHELKYVELSMAEPQTTAASVHLKKPRSICFIIRLRVKSNKTIITRWHFVHLGSPDTALKYWGKGNTKDPCINCRKWLPPSSLLAFIKRPFPCQHSGPVRQMGKGELTQPSWPAVVVPAASSSRREWLNARG